MSALMSPPGTPAAQEQAHPAPPAGRNGPPLCPGGDPDTCAGRQLPAPRVLHTISTPQAAGALLPAVPYHPQT